MRDTLFIRLLNQSDKGEALARRIAALREGQADKGVYAVNPESFRQVPNTPFCYWVSERIRRLFRELPPFESDGRTVKVGLQTGDDFRFVRAWWEVPAERILDGRKYAEGSRQKEREEKWTEERIREFQAWCRKRTYEGKHWAPFAKGGEYSPYYADIHLLVNWEKEGAEIRNFADPKTGKTNSRPQNTDYYFRPGLTYRSGYYTRGLVTRVGTVELRVLQDRQGRFSTEIFERYQRSEKALVSALVEMYVQGVSTRKVKAITEPLCGHEFSASSVSRVNKTLDEQLAQFYQRPLEEPYPYLVLDARCEKVREDGVIRSRAVLVAIGINDDGRRCVLGVELANRESRSRWRDFLIRLKERGLRDVEFIVSDDHEGLKKAVSETLPPGGVAALLRTFLA